MTDEPVIVERDEAWNAAFGERSNDGRRKTGQVMNVRDIGLEVVEDAAGDTVDGVIAVGLRERTRVAEGIVHRNDAQALALLATNLVFGPPRILLAREDDDFVAEIVPQRACVCMRVDLAATLSGRRKAVDDDQGFHRTSAPSTKYLTNLPGGASRLATLLLPHILRYSRSSRLASRVPRSGILPRYFALGTLKSRHTILERNGFQPLIADNAPRYCPSGHANANAIARAAP